MIKCIVGLMVSAMLFCSASISSAVSPTPPSAVGAGAILVVGYLLFHKKSEKTIEKKTEKKDTKKKTESKGDKVKPKK
jgi:hypothetical protein